MCCHVIPVLSRDPLSRRARRPTAGQRLPLASVGLPPLIPPPRFVLSGGPLYLCSWGACKGWADEYGGGPRDS